MARLMTTFAALRLPSSRRLPAIALLTCRCQISGVNGYFSQADKLNISAKPYKGCGHHLSTCLMCNAAAKKGRILALHRSSHGKYAGYNSWPKQCLNTLSVEGSADAETSNRKESYEEAKKDGTESVSTQKVPAHFRGVAQLKETFSHLSEPCEQWLNHLESRKISRKTVARNQLKELYTRRHGPVIAFPYFMDGELVSIKYRTLGKTFWQEKQSLKVFYGLHDVVNAKEIIIVEGELDKLAMEEAGFLNCLSVPDGAPARLSDPDKSSIEAEDKKFLYVWNCKDYLDKVSRIIIATDGDEPGQVLAEELARRIGRERCWRVQWPQLPNGKKKCKDANEVLMELGVEALQLVVQTAELYPIRGLFTFDDFFQDLDNYYKSHGEDQTGISTGWPCLDNFYKVVPGELTLVTGVPGSGKSEWLDALAVNLAESKGWTFAFCSMENKVEEHARKLIEKHCRKPFFDAIYTEGRERLSSQELEIGKQWIDDKFYLIRCEDDELPSVDWVLNLARAAVMRHGIRGLVIDPYNELDHQRKNHQTETEYVSAMLTKIKRFAQHYSCHVWLVAHPRQLQSWMGEAPSLYDVSGSAHFINKCDNGIIIHRNQNPSRGTLNQVEVLVRKARNKVSGALGEAALTYDRITGLYTGSKVHTKV